MIKRYLSIFIVISIYIFIIVFLINDLKTALSTNIFFVIYTSFLLLGLLLIPVVIIETIVRRNAYIKERGNMPNYRPHSGYFPKEMKALKEYMQNNSKLHSLENDYIEILNDFYNEGIYIRCIEKSSKKIFTITGDANLVATLWCILQKEWNKNYNFNGLKLWFYSMEDILVEESE